MTEREIWEGAIRGLLATADWHELFGDHAKAAEWREAAEDYRIIVEALPSG